MPINVSPGQPLPRKEPHPFAFVHPLGVFAYGYRPVGQTGFGEACVHIVSHIGNGAAIAREDPSAGYDDAPGAEASVSDEMGKVVGGTLREADARLLCTEGWVSVEPAGGKDGVQPLCGRHLPMLLRHLGREAGSLAAAGEVDQRVALSRTDCLEHQLPAVSTGLRRCSSLP
jgi:hypothetical protein